QRPEPACLQISEPVIGEPTGLFLLDEPCVLEEFQVPRDAGLREAKNRGQFTHVQPLETQNPQQTEPRLATKQPVQGGGVAHIYESTSVDTTYTSPLPLEIGR